jgi:hypothetical protein
MIDTEKKIIYFGYGDVLVGSNFITLSFTGIKPPLKVGTEVTEEITRENNIERITEPVKFKFTDLTELLWFQTSLKGTDGTTSVFFRYEDWIFDFTNYNTKSINIILRHIECIKKNLIQWSAC